MKRIKRIMIYLQEMYPVASRMFVAIVCFCEVYFVLLLNKNITDFNFGYQEVIGIWTIFSFLLMLRIADDFKDYELDCRLFPHRPLPSGRVYKKDLAILLTLVVSITVILNLAFMPNKFWFIFLYVYGTLMSFWFFKRELIQNSLPLALVTHNPVMMILNWYTISFVCDKYSLELFQPTTILLALTLYFPSLIWEVSRKIRAPKEETEYVTYSKLFGYKKVTTIVMVLTVLDVLTNIILLYKISMLGVIVLILNISWMVYKFISYIQNPYAFNIKQKVEQYTYITETTMVVGVILYLISQGI